MPSKPPDGTAADDTDARDAQRALSQAQFGANAANYATSTVHAKGHSLTRLVELVPAQPEWEMLDIATAAGHVAFAFAPLVASVIASDVTPEMLEVTAASTAEAGIDNVTTRLADAHDLGFEDASFDLVTCRIAPHHFAEPARFVAEAARVLRPGATFALVDNVAPPDPETARWCDDFERRRDPSHLRCLPMQEWLALCEANGLEVVSAETIGKKMAFVPWCDNMSVPAQTRAELLSDLASAPEAAAGWLLPSFGEDRTDQAGASFVLTEGIIIATKR